MGSRFPSCCPRGRRRRRGGQPGQHQPPPGSPSDAPDGTAAPPRSPAPGGSTGDGSPRDGRAYFSGKARVSFRHQLDSERDATN